MGTNIGGAISPPVFIFFSFSFENTSGYLYTPIYLKVRRRKISVKFQLKGGICKPCLDIPPNWKDMRSEFGYKLLYAIVSKRRKTGRTSIHLRHMHININK
ncbi:hypothetical protein C5S31_02535 [ANME-1 cluster archaeon GoMg2]|nr:hypothetical protein [ANME-1 cluster archaeon GoMg2]